MVRQMHQARVVWGTSAAPDQADSCDHAVKCQTAMIELRVLLLLIHRSSVLTRQHCQCLRVDLRPSLLLGAAVSGRTKLCFPKSNLFFPDLDANPNTPHPAFLVASGLDAPPCATPAIFAAAAVDPRSHGMAAHPPPRHLKPRRFDLRLAMQPQMLTRCVRAPVRRLRLELRQAVAVARTR